MTMSAPPPPPAEGDARQHGSMNPFDSNMLTGMNCDATAIAILPHYYYLSNDASLTISQLPREVFNTIMAFLKSKDRNSVAATCSTFRKDVEDFSKLKLESIITTIGAAIQTDAAAAKLPYRHLLWTALTTPLPFTFDVYQGGSKAVLLDTSVDGDDTLLIAESGDSHALCQVWDFSSGQSLQTVALGAGGAGGIDHMVQCGNLLVVASFGALSVWNWSGERIFGYGNFSFSVQSMHAMGDLVYIKYSFFQIIIAILTHLLSLILPIQQTLSYDKH